MQFAASALQTYPSGSAREVPEVACVTKQSVPKGQVGQVEEAGSRIASV